VTRPYDRPATITAVVNATVVYLLPLAAAGAIALFASHIRNTGSGVVGVDPDRAAVWRGRGQFIVGYIMGIAPFAMAAAWRTFVHARRWLEKGSRGVLGIIEGGVCGFAGAVVVLLPGIVTKPAQASGYVLAYGGLAAVLGLAVGAVRWISATLTLTTVRRPG
jgi:hypothetical protein